ncbi:MAG: hypothetical protein RPS47_04730 [Colwellia sp.]|jgi:hypothetical protein
MSDSTVNVEHDATDEGMFLKALEAIRELDEEICGGLASLADAAEKVSVEGVSAGAAATLKIRNQMMDVKKLILTACDQMEEEGRSSQNNRQVYIAQQTRNKFLAYIERIELPGNGQIPTNDLREKRTTRRRLFGALGLGLGVAAVAGGMTASPNANAFGGSAALVPYLSKMLVEAKKTYDVMVEELNKLNDLNEGMQKVNDAFVRGIDGLLMMDQEENVKKMVADAVAADRNVNTLLEIERASVQLGSNPGSSPCSSDAGGVVTNALTKKKKSITVKQAGDNVSAALDDSAKNSSQSEGGLIHREIKNGDSSGVNGAQLIEKSYNGQSREYVLARERVKRRMTAEPSVLPKGSIESASKTVEGRKFIADYTTRYIRRSVADGAIQDLDRSLRGSSKAFEKMESQIKSVADTDTSYMEADEASQVDSRLVAYGGELKDLLASITEGGSTLSLMEAFEFQVKSKDLSTFHEIYRSSGNEPAPLLRELIAMESINLKMQYETLIQSRQQTSLLSNLLLITQDSPDRVGELLNARKNFTK